jgi:hypothetical protein
MEYLKDGTFDTKFLVTHRVKLEDFPELYNAFDKRYAGKYSFASQTRRPIDLTPRCEQGLRGDFYQVSTLIPTR